MINPHAYHVDALHAVTAQLTLCQRDAPLYY